MLNVNEDGLVESLYHFLWLTDDMKGKQPFNFSIPDTLIYKYQQPIFWFFSSRDGYILKKETNKLNNQKIKEAFLSKKGESGIVAYYIANKKRSNTILRELAEQKEEQGGADKYTTKEEKKQR